MSTQSAIEWTDATWNPTSGCTKVSPGCANCYIERTPPMRMAGRKFVGGKIPMQLHADRLDAPLHWRKPRRVFVNSMSDLFHEDVPDEFIDKVFAVMALCPQHTFQVLTKRAKRMRDYFATLPHSNTGSLINRWYRAAQKFMDIDEFPEHTGEWDWTMEPGRPLDNVWCGVSAEDQPRLDERVGFLLQTPAAVRFLSCEPLLGPVDLHLKGIAMAGRILRDRSHGISWVIDGCESGPKRREYRVEWSRSIQAQCAASGVAFFRKQTIIDGKVSHDPAEWPEDLRIREFPNDDSCSSSAIPRNM